MKKPLAASLAVAIALSGCASATKDIGATYVSPLQYQGLDCEQLIGESARIQGRFTQLGGRLDEAASNDKAITAAGIILFWPALFFLGGTKQQEAEYARLKGEHDALQQVTVMRKCNGSVPALPAASIPASVTTIQADK